MGLDDANQANDSAEPTAELPNCGAAERKGGMRQTGGWVRHRSQEDGHNHEILWRLQTRDPLHG
jgi:hypothetical protein